MGTHGTPGGPGGLLGTHGPPLRTQGALGDPWAPPEDPGGALGDPWAPPEDPGGPLGTHGPLGPMGPPGGPGNIWGTYYLGGTEVYRPAHMRRFIKGFLYFYIKRDMGDHSLLGIPLGPRGPQFAAPGPPGEK